MPAFTAQAPEAAYDAVDDVDAVAIARVLGGDAEAFRDLVERYPGRGALNDGAFEETNGDARYQIVLGTSRDMRSPTSFAAIKVPSGHCFLLGDNRHESIDSRQIGPVPLANIIGRVARVL